MTRLRSRNTLRSLSQGLASLMLASTFSATPAFAQAQNAPLISKYFVENVVDGITGSNLVIQLINPNNNSATLTAALVDNLPAGVVPNGGSVTTCAGGIASNTPTTISLSAGAVIPANGSCIITTPVFAALGGTYTNTILAGALQTTNGANLEPVSASLTSNSVLVPLGLGKAFEPATINFGQTSTLVISVTNTNALTPITGVAFNDLLPVGLQSTGNGIIVGAGCLGTLGGTPLNVVLTGGTVPPLTTCSYEIPVRALRSGDIINTLGVGSVTGALITAPVANTFAASSTLAVIPPVFSPTVLKAFIPDAVECGNSTLVITLINPTAVPATLSSPLIDRLPNALRTFGAATTTCVNGVASAQNLFGYSTVSLLSGTIPAASSCEIRVRVGSNCNATFLNRIAPGALQTNVGPNTNIASATVSFCCLAASIDEESLECTYENTVDEENMSLLD